MRLVRRRPDVSALDIPAGERLIASATTASGRPIAATSNALYPAPGQRIPWSDISSADWEQPFLAIVLLDDQGVPRDRIRVELDATAASLAAAVHDRVTASVVVTERVEFEAGGSALMTARRDSDTGEIRWAVLFETGLDPRDKDLRVEVTQRLSQLRGSLGI